MQKRLTTISKLLLVFLALIFIIYPMGKLNAREINSQEINFYDGFIELYPFYSGEELKVEKIIPGTQKGLYLTGYSMSKLEKRKYIN